jgi:diacylglycerol kinase family enzyme
MNMLPHAVYGARPWAEALRLALTEGRERDLAGGCIENHRFLVAAILGSAALWAPAREAARYGKPRLALLRARRAMRRAFTGRLRYSLDGGLREKAEALVLMCPIASKIMRTEDAALEAAALNPRGAGEVVRLGLNALVRDWRVDPAVDDRFCRVARAWAAHGIPAILDGESVRLPSLVEARYDPKICRVLAPPKEVR